MSRSVTIVADDYGIGRETSRAILELAIEQRISATVLIVNAPDSERATREWLAASPCADLGWHPNLTLDRPVSSPFRIPTLVRPDGAFWPLASFLKRVCLRLISPKDVRTELAAQYRRFVDLVGRPPPLVNSHQHIALFPPCETTLLDVLAEQNCRPYLRRVVEQGHALVQIAGDRVKRTCLSVMGRRAARRAAARGLPGCHTLVGISNQRHFEGRDWNRRLTQLSNAASVEIYCHPGYRDESLIGRDCAAGELERRTRELDWLRSSSFRDAFRRNGLAPTRPSALLAGGQ